MSIAPEQPPALAVDDASPVLGGDAPSASSASSASSKTVPPSLATMASNHPYSTAFLLGAALTGSAVIGGMAARRALGQSHRAALVAAEAAASRPAAARVPSAIKGEYDSRLLKLEALVKDAQQANKKMAEQMVAIPQLVKGLERVQADLAQEQSAALKAQRSYWDKKFEDNQVIAEQVQKLSEGLSALTARSGDSLQSEKSVAQAFRSRMTTDVQELLATLAAVEAEVKQLSAALAPAKSATETKPTDKKASKASTTMEDEEEGGLDATQGDFCFFPQRETPSSASTSSAAMGAAAGAASTASKGTSPSSSSSGNSGASPSGSASGSSSSSRPWSSDQAETRSHQPIARLGVDESGEWKFKLDPANQGTDQLFGSHLKPRSIVLCRQSEKRSDLGLPFLSSTTKMTYVYGPFVTGIVFNPEVDMVLLDGAWWRVTEEDGVFTVREKVADDSL